jgi:phosphoribosylformylglycinamidine synthase
VARTAEPEFATLCAQRELPCQRIGVVDLLVPELDIAGQFRVSLRELRAAWGRRLPDRFES